MSDNEIMFWYMKGFNDELYGTTSTIDDELSLKAYNLGATHAIVGDDIRSVDYLTNEEILNMIKNK